MSCTSRACSASAPASGGHAAFLISSPVTWPAFRRSPARAARLGDANVSSDTGSGSRLTKVAERTPSSKGLSSSSSAESCATWIVSPLRRYRPSSMSMQLSKEECTLRKAVQTRSFRPQLSVASRLGAEPAALAKGVSDSPKGLARRMGVPPRPFSVQSAELSQRGSMAVTSG
eukprot:scaffold7059_cov250-Pinguiococcus_pyrenoidosus.AAC.18